MPQCLCLFSFIRSCPWLWEIGLFKLTGVNIMVWDYKHIKCNQVMISFS